MRVIEENSEKFLVAVGCAVGEELDAVKVRWVIGDIPIDYHNCVVRSELSREEVDSVILEPLERFRAQGAPGS